MSDAARPSTRLEALLAGEPLLDAAPAEAADDAIAQEQLEAIRAHWDRRPLSPGELARVRLRTGALGPASRARQRRLVVTVAALSFILGAGVAFGTSGLGRNWRVAPAPATSGGEPAGTPPTPVPAPRGTHLPGPSAAPAPSEGAGDTAPVHSGATGARVGAVPSADRGQWQRALGALKQDDAAAAERALAELGSDPDVVKRESAQLSLATLWLQQGKTERALPVLRRLAASSASPYIRARASELLRSH